MEHVRRLIKPSLMSAAHQLKTLPPLFKLISLNLPVAKAAERERGGGASERHWEGGGFNPGFDEALKEHQKFSVELKSHVEPSGQHQEERELLLRFLVGDGVGRTADTSTNSP